MKWRVRIRRVLLATGAVAVLVIAALIPVAVFAAPVPSASDDDGLIPWELSGAIWNECPMTAEVPNGYGLGWSADALGDWHVSLYDEQGTEMPEVEVFTQYPELVAPIQAYFACLNRFPTTEYREPPVFNSVQLELYWSYLRSQLAPCLRDHGYEARLPTQRFIESTDTMTWYMEAIHAWDGTVPLEELLTVWNECPIYPSYLENTTRDVVSVELQQAG
jgi:hypothetical protein